MQFRLLKLRFHRKLRRSQRQVESFGEQAEKTIEHHLMERFDNIRRIRLFLLMWMGLMVVAAIGLIIQTLDLSGYYQTLKPVPGGVYNEGVLGSFTTANPLYATSDADTTVSHLIFAGLLKYDEQGNLVGDLASGYAVSDHGLVYTVHLKPNLKWQDGKPLTSADVLFTYQVIQNPDAGSPLETSWQNVQVTAPDPLTVTFKLPGTLASFPYSLTNGIVPEHLLQSVPPTELRSADFNTLHPVGAGPFSFEALQVSGSDASNTEAQIALVPFKGYEGGAPKLQKFDVSIFASKEQLQNALVSGQVTGAEGLNEVPPAIIKKKSVIAHNLPLRAATMVFFKTTSGVLADKAVRNALVQGANVPAAVAALGYPVQTVNEPLLEGQVGYNPSYAQPAYNLSSAIGILTSDGWAVGKNGVRYKNNQPLAFTISAADTRDNHAVGDRLVTQWKQLGANVSMDYLDNLDFQQAVTYHNYDAVLDGITIGEDPDVYVYWDSSQADVRSPERLNLSEYSSSTADSSLEEGRSRLDPVLRAVIYRQFLQSWQQDSPALALYQPRLLYITNGQVTGLADNPISTPADRFANVQNWEVKEAKVTD